MRMRKLRQHGLKKLISLHSHAEDDLQVLPGASHYGLSIDDAGQNGSFRLILETASTLRLRSRNVGLH